MYCHKSIALKVINLDLFDHLNMFSDKLGFLHGLLMSRLGPQGLLALLLTCYFQSPAVNSCVVHLPRAIVQSLADQ